MSEPSELARAQVLVPLISAGLFLYVGFGLGLVGISGDAVYDCSVTALVWGARIVGLGLLLVAALNWRGVPGLSGLEAAAGSLLIGGIWLVFNDVQGLLWNLLGIWNSSVSANAWRRWRQRGPIAKHVDAP